ncbi:TraC family protein [Vibrio cholerae]|nr:TraC family protein [Vibrio cholerae]
MNNFVEKLLLGNQFLTSSDVNLLSNRARLSDYLPYLKFRQHRKEVDEKGNVEHVEVNEFLLSDATYGLAWECRPLTFVGQKALKSLAGVLKQNFPTGTIIQWNLWTDSDMTEIIKGFEAGKQFKDPISARSAEETKKWLLLCADGIPKMSGIPARTFRLMVSIKSPSPLSHQIIDGVRNNLRGAGLSPKPVTPERMRSVVGSVINGKTPKEMVINPQREIRRQIIDKGISVSFPNDKDYARIGDRYACCLTPSDVPRTNDPIQTNQLFGGFEGLNDDTRQITTPFWYSLSVVVKDQKNMIKAKQSVLQWQKVGRSMSNKLEAASREFELAIKNIEQDKGKEYMFIPSMWIFGKDRREMERGAGEVCKLWEDQGFEMQRERLVKSAMFIASLPFGLYNVENNLDNLDRHFIADIEDIARFLPVQGDFIGAGSPTNFYFGRKGQVVGMNHFDPRVNAYNFLVAGGTGTGKTFNLNDMLSGYADSGYKLRMTDMGGGFEKLCAMKGGRYFDFRLSRDIPCINPLDFDDLDDPEERAKGIDTAVNQFGLMANSHTGKRMDELEIKLIEEAVKAQWKAGNKEGGAEVIRQYLSAYAKVGVMKDVPEISRKAEIIAYQMRDFCAGGEFEKIFCGKNQFDIANEQIVTVELEHLRSIKSLYQVVTLQMMNAITQDLYLGDRATQTVILFEEVLSFLNKNGQTDTSYYAGMVDEGYRRARKYRGSMGVVLQSMLDIEALGEIGHVVNSQAVFKYYLESTAFDEAIRRGCIQNVQEGSFVQNLLNSIKSNRPNYSEFFLDAGALGMGVVRLCVDRWRYGVNTSDGADFATYKHMTSNGFTQEQAIEHIAGIKKWM